MSETIFLELIKIAAQLAAEHIRVEQPDKDDRMKIFDDYHNLLLKKYSVYLATLPKNVPHYDTDP